MKKTIKYLILTLMVSGILGGCSDWIRPEHITIQDPDKQSPILRDDAYYAALREYKKTKHKIAFGWYGSWTATGASYQSRLASAPDSMDIISIWSQWHSLTPEQMADKEYLQKVKGTKVTFTTFLDNIPAEFRAGEVPTHEEIANFAKAWGRDSINKYSYDGMDIDYEPGYGASGPLVGHDNELFKVLITELGKYLGPKSGTGKLLMIDGVPYAVHTEMAEYFDYGIVQAYASSGYTDLQNRFNNAYAKGWKPEQYIFAENFESYWKNGGVTHTTRDGQKVNSLLGMARFNPTQGFCAGFGAYHMEYEYGNAEKQYKYMREAIQDVNPAGGMIPVSLGSSSTASYLILVNQDGSFSGSVDASISLNLSKPAPADATFEVILDNSLVETYNAENGTVYQSVDPSKVNLTPIQIKIGEIASEAASIGFNPEGLEKGHYLLPVSVILPDGGDYVSEENLTYYIIINLNSMDIDTEATAVTGVKIQPQSSWTINCYNGLNTSGATGVWNLDTDEQKQAIFDGQTGRGWYTMTSSYNEWGTKGGNFIIELDKVYKLSGFRYHLLYAEQPAATINDFLYSTDGKNWYSLSSEIPFKAKTDSEKWKIFQFKRTVDARYIRVIFAPLTSRYVSMDEAEFYTPEN